MACEVHGVGLCTAHCQAASASQESAPQDAEARERDWNRYVFTKHAILKDTERDTFAFAWEAGFRSRDAELERVTRELAELRATGVTDERLASDALRLRDVLQTAVLPLGRTRAELVGMLDRIAALAARGGR